MSISLSTIVTGIGSYQSLSAPSRTTNVAYTNSTAKPIFVWICIGSNGNGDSTNFYINNNLVSAFAISANESATFTHTGIIPVGSNYKVTIGGNAVLNTWWELS
jgi:hypothetical protein